MAYVTDLSKHFLQAYVQEMVREAYENWERLEETNGNGILYNNVLQSTCTKLGLNYSLVAIVLECS